MRVAIASPLRVPDGRSPNAKRMGSTFQGGQAARNDMEGDDGASERSVVGSP